MLDQITKRTMKLITTNESGTIEKMTKIFESIHLIITKHQDELKQKILSIEKENQDLMKKFQKKLRNKQEKVNKWSRDFEDNLAAKNYTKLLQDHKKSIGYLKSTTRDLSEVKYPVPTTYHIEKIDQLQEAIANILERTSIADLDQGNIR